MINIIWIGIYQEDIENFNIYGSICKFGINKSKHFVATPGDNYYSFIISKVKYFKSLDVDIKYYFYDQYLAYSVAEYINENECICLNSRKNLDWLNNKAITREWIRSQVKTPESIVLSKSEIRLDEIRNLCIGYNKFLLQKMISSSKHATYLFSNNPNDYILDDTELYLVSPFYEKAISLNVTIIIGLDDTIYFPPSIQYIAEENAHLLYRGSDFILPKNLPQSIIKNLKNCSKKIAKLLKSMGYKGVCGIDFLLYNDRIYFLEINPRFQGSSFLIEKALNKQNLSLYEINFRAFYGQIKEIKNQIDKIKINYSFYKSGDIREYKTHSQKKLELDYNSNDYYDFFADKYYIMLKDWKGKIDKQGKILLNLMKKYSHIKISTLLDCTCGIGIQAISLAQEGLDVTGSDISQNELKFAIKEAQKRNLKIFFTQADCRYLDQVFNNNFDAIISIDSALPHLITKENFLLTFKSIYNRLNKGGVFLSSYRDYAELLKTKPNMAYPIRFNTEGDKEYTIFRKWKWDKDIIYSKQYVIVDTEEGSKLYTNSYKQWAITKSDLLAIARETRYSEIYWLLPEESQFSQPILCLVK